MRFIVSYTKEKSDQLRLCLSEIQEAEVEFASGLKRVIVPGHVYETSEEYVELLDNRNGQLELVILGSQDNIDKNKLKMQLSRLGLGKRMAEAILKTSFSNEDLNSNTAEYVGECVTELVKYGHYVILRNEKNDHYLVRKNKVALDNFVTSILKGDFDSNEDDENGDEDYYVHLEYVIRGLNLWKAKLVPKYERVNNGKKNKG